MIRGRMKRRAELQVHKRDRRKNLVLACFNHPDIHNLESAWPGIARFNLPNWQHQRGQCEYGVTKRERNCDRLDRAAAHRPVDLAITISGSLLSTTKIRSSDGRGLGEQPTFDGGQGAPARCAEAWKDRYRLHLRLWRLLGAPAHYYRAGQPGVSYPRYIGGERNGPPEDAVMGWFDYHLWEFAIDHENTV